MPSPRVVLDTNVIVSAHLKPEGLERFVLDLALSRRLLLFLTREILEEYASVLCRPKFELPKRMVAASMVLIQQHSTLVGSTQILKMAIDPADGKFLECAESAHAEYLVTGNKRHFPAAWKTTRVVNARELLNLIVPEVPGLPRSGG